MFINEEETFNFFLLILENFSQRLLNKKGFFLCVLKEGKTSN